MRVMHLLHSLGRGGLERVVVSVANGLARRGWPQAVCCLHDSGPLCDALDESIELFVLNAPPNCVTLPWQLRRVYRSFSPDVIDIVDFGSWPDATLACIGLRGIRRVRTFHGFLDSPPRRWRWAGHVLARMTHAIRAVSPDVADAAAKLYRIPRKRIDVVPNGIDVERFDPQVVQDSTTTYRRPHARLTCVTVASLSPVKDPLLLVDVCRRLGPEVHFVWVGDGPLRDAMATAIAEAGLTESFTLAGAADDVRPKLAAADVFVLPSRSEAAPLCVLEAMAMQRPVVAARVGDLPAIVEKAGAGLLVDGRDAATFAEAIGRLRDDAELRTAMGRRGRETVVRRYSIDAMLDHYQRSYEQTYAGRREVEALAPAPLGGA